MWSYRVSRLAALALALITLGSPLGSVDNLSAQRIEGINTSLLVIILGRICLENRTKNFPRMNFLSRTKITTY